VLERFAADLTARFGHGFSQRNLEDFRLFYSAANSTGSVDRGRGPAARTPLPNAFCRIGRWDIRIVAILASN